MTELGIGLNEASQARVLFFVPFGAWVVHNQLDAVLASSLQLRGASVAAVLCDGLFNSCYVTRFSSNPAADCAHCARVGKSLFSTFQLPQIQLRDRIKQDELAAAQKIVEPLTASELRLFEYKGAALGELLSGTVGSYYRVAWDQLDRPDAVELLRLYLAYAIVTFDALDRLFDEFHPTHLCLMNGRGYLHSPAFALAKIRGVKIVAHERGYYDGSFMLCDDDVAGGFSGYRRISKAWESIPLKIEEAQRLKDYFVARERGQNLNFHSYYNFDTDRSQVRSRLGIPERAKILSVFTSSEYELLYSWKQYQGVARQMDVIDRLIDVFGSEPEFRDSYLVIRHHPSMSFGPSLTSPQTRSIQRAYDQAMTAPANVRIIMPDESLTSYALLWNSHASIVFASTLRHEAAARAIPVACADNDFLYQGISHVIFDESRAGLRSLVQALFQHGDKFTVEDLRRLYRTAYSYFFRHSVTFNSFSIKNNFDANIKISHTAELAPGNDPTLDRICDHILHGRSIFQLPTAEDWAQNTEAEDAFLQSEIESLRAVKENTAKAAEIAIAEQPTQKVKVLRYLPASGSNDPNVFDRWTTRQRYRSFSVTSVAAAGATVSEQIQTLLEVVNTLQEDYVLLSNELFYYDECLLRDGMEILSNDSSLDGVSWGGWIRGVDGTIVDSIFTKKNPVASYSEAVRLMSCLTDPLQMLSFCLWRRSAFQRILLAVHESSHRDLGPVIFAILRSSAMKQRQLPLILVNCPPPAEQAEISQYTPARFSVSAVKSLTGVSCDTARLVPAAECQDDKRERILQLLGGTSPLISQIDPGSCSQAIVEICRK